MTWMDNTIMFWHDGNVFQKITDHGRAPLNVSVERIERPQRMANGTYRRYSIAKKRSWTASWTNLPSTNTKSVGGGLTTVDNGLSGEQMESFHNSHDGAFLMQLRRGDGTVETVTVMITDFSKEIVKRGPRVDLWNLSVTLIEV